MFNLPTFVLFLVIAQVNSISMMKILRKNKKTKHEFQTCFYGQLVLGHAIFLDFFYPIDFPYLFKFFFINDLLEYFHVISFITNRNSQPWELNTGSQILHLSDRLQYKNRFQSQNFVERIVGNLKHLFYFSLKQKKLIGFCSRLL